MFQFMKEKDLKLCNHISLALENNHIATDIFRCFCVIKYPQLIFNRLFIPIQQNCTNACAKTLSIYIYIYNSRFIVSTLQFQKHSYSLHFFNAKKKKSKLFLQKGEIFTYSCMLMSSNSALQVTVLVTSPADFWYWDSYSNLSQLRLQYVKCRKTVPLKYDLSNLVEL